jgi:hypothetical protein
MKIDRIETGRRTIRMMANFLHRPISSIEMAQDLRKDWDMTEGDFEVLEIWIEGPISQSLPGFFQDVGADVHRADLKDPDTVSTIGTLSDLIWTSIPEANQQES